MHSITHQGFEGHRGGHGQLAHLLFDTITLGFVGSGTSESISPSFLATPSGFKNQDMVVENKAGLMVRAKLALAQKGPRSFDLCSPIKR